MGSLVGIWRNTPFELTFKVTLTRLVLVTSLTSKPSDLISEGGIGT
jgi:hypothetical protein